jgi:hypothetical protein
VSEQQYDEEWLLEMSCRKLDRALEERLNQRLQLGDRREYESKYSLEELTALRRAQGRRDPLEVRVTIDESAGQPRVLATLQNVDEERVSFLFYDGGDDRTGRRERWRIDLIDEHGRVADSNYLWLGMGGGIAGLHDLQYGEEGRRQNALNIRKYLAPPRSGVYSLRVSYHNERNLAGPTILDGLIYSQSAPLRVRVHNPEDPATVNQRSYIPATVATLAALLAIGSLFVARRRQPRRLAWRDLIWGAAIAAVALLWQCDQWHQARELRRLRPDEETLWRIEAIR